MRRVADVRLAPQMLIGAHPRDPWSITAPLAGPPLPTPIRVALVADPPGGTTDPVVRDATRQAAGALAAAGYEIVEICPPRYEEAIVVWRQVMRGDFVAVLDELPPLMGRDGATFLTRVNSGTTARS
jgi:amidase